MRRAVRMKPIRDLRPDGSAPEPPEAAELVAAMRALAQDMICGLCLRRLLGTRSCVATAKLADPRLKTMRGAAAVVVCSREASLFWRAPAGRYLGTAVASHRTPR